MDYLFMYPITIEFYNPLIEGPVDFLNATEFIIQNMYWDEDAGYLLVYNWGIPLIVGLLLAILLIILVWFAIWLFSKRRKKHD